MTLGEIGGLLFLIFVGLALAGLAVRVVTELRA